MKNQASFIDDLADIMGESLDAYDAQAWALIAIYEKVYGVGINAETVRECKERAQKLADALERIESQL